VKKLINEPADVVREALEGVARATTRAALVEGTTVLVRTDLTDDQVAVIAGGGSGHEPAHAGYVGPGHLAGAVCGEVFASPSTDAVLTGLRTLAAPEGPGALLVVMNYTGDRLNFGLAAQLARAEGIATEMVTVADDVALDADDEVTAGRRGLAGTVLVTKVAGAAAGRGDPLERAGASIARRPGARRGRPRRRPVAPRRRGRGPVGGRGDRDDGPAAGPVELPRRPGARAPGRGGGGRRGVVGRHVRKVPFLTLDVRNPSSITALYSPRARLRTSRRRSTRSAISGSVPGSARAATTSRRAAASATDWSRAHCSRRRRMRASRSR
jgi:Dak1 domain-containing protein